MNIVNCTYSLIFAPMPEIRRSLFALEDCISGYLKPFQLISLPENAPLDLPRITASAEDGRSTLTITGQSAQVISLFDKGFDGDEKAKLDYSREMALGLFHALGNMPGMTVLFAGLSVQFDMPASELGEDPAKFINKSYLNVESGLTLSDAAAKLVYTLEGDYFLNLEVKKQIAIDPLSFSVSPSGVVINLGTQHHEEYLSVIVDFNNRLAFNEGRPAGCSDETLSTLYRHVHSFAEEGMDVFLEKGEVRF